jgi:hypothetical protein
MKNLLSKLKPLIRLLLTLISLATIYVAIAALFDSWGLPIPFKNKPDQFSKVLTVSASLLTGLLTWVSFRVNIEMFSGPEVAAVSYYETFCKKVIRGSGLLPCYIFIPERLVQLDAVEDFIGKIEKKKLTCIYDDKRRIYVVTNTRGEKVYLDFPSVLRNLGLVASSEGKFKKSDSLEKDLISNFQKCLESKLSIVYKKPGFFGGIKRWFGIQEAKHERTDEVPFYFIDPKAIINDPHAGFRTFSDTRPSEIAAAVVS